MKFTLKDYQRDAVRDALDNLKQRRPGMYDGKMASTVARATFS